MKKTIFILIFAVLVSSSLLAQDLAVATVRYKRTEPVSGRQLDETITALEQQQGRDLSEQERRLVLDQMIDQMLIIQAAEATESISVTDEEVENAGMRFLSQQLTAVGAIPAGAVLTDKAQYKLLVEQQGATIEDFESIIRKQLLAEKYVTSMNKASFQSIGEATPIELSTEYQRRIAEFAISDSVMFNQIFFDTRNLSAAEADQKKNKAQEVLRRLINTAATFADLVISNSEDETSKARGGLTGPLMKGDEVAEQLYGANFVQAVFDLELQKVSTVLKSNVGYHIVQIAEKKTAQLLPMNDPEVSKYLEQIIYAEKYQQKFDKEVATLIADLRSQSTINYFDEKR